jgi:hypothetical protein
MVSRFLLLLLLLLLSVVIANSGSVANVKGRTHEKECRKEANRRDESRQPSNTQAKTHQTQQSHKVQSFLKRIKICDCFVCFFLFKFRFPSRFPI